MNNKPMPTKDELNGIFSYDDTTGFLYWKIKVGKRFKPGDMAGSIKKNKYYKVAYKSKEYFCSRIIMILNDYDIVDKEIDHIDGNPMNNRIDNLRAVSHRVNQRNCKLSKNNKSGQIGVHWNTREKAWRVYILGKTYLTTKNINTAIQTAKNIYNELGFHKNHGRHN